MSVAKESIERARKAHEFFSSLYGTGDWDNFLSLFFADLMHDGITDNDIFLSQVQASTWYFDEKRNTEAADAQH